MGCGTNCVKYLLFIFNLIIALLALAVIGIGVAVLLKSKVIEGVGGLTVAPWVFIGIGSVMFVIAFFGCCGAILESNCMIVTYAIFLVVIIIAQVALGALMFTYAQSIEDGLVRSVDAIYDKRASDPVVTTVIDNLQEQLSCCGKNGPTDYGFGVLNLPRSCCATTTIGNQCMVIDAYNVGCSPRIAELYNKWNKIIAGVAIGLASAEVIGVIFSLYLSNSITNRHRRSRY